MKPGKAYGVLVRFFVLYLKKSQSFMKEEKFNTAQHIHRSSANISDHLANERTFLAWIRTSIGIMAFGFVVVKFALFIKQLSIMFNKNVAPSNENASVIGISLVVFGLVMSLCSFFQYKHIEKQLLRTDYNPSSRLSTLLIISMLLIGILLVMYLVYSI